MAVLKTIANSNAATKAEIRALTEKPSNYLDVKQVRSSIDAAKLCTVPTYVVGDDDVVHPCVIYLETPVSGYRWWMVATPYSSGAEAETENPSIWVSSDGETWSDPTGNNPVVPWPGGASDNNSDTFIWWDDDDAKFYVVYREYISSGLGLENLRLIESTDGLTWTSPLTIYATTANINRPSSPSINKKPDGTYIMHTVDTSSTPKVIQYQTCATLTGTWTDPTTCTYVMPPGGEVDCWHPEIRLTDVGQYLGCIQIDDSSGGPIYMITSDDGITFTFGAKLTVNDQDYKSSFVQLSNSKAYLYKGNIQSRDVVRMVLTMDREAYYLSRAYSLLNSVELATDSLAGFVHADKFQRADNASTPGTADSGTAWTVESGTMGILSNALYAPVGGNSKCTLPLTNRDSEVYCKASVYSQNLWIIFRYQDGSNFWRLGGKTSGTLRLDVIISGAVAQQWTVSMAIANNDAFGIRLIGDDIGILLNDLPLLTLNDSRLNGNLKAGVQMSDGTERVTHFFIKSL